MGLFNKKSVQLSNSLNQATAQALDGLSAADEKELFAFAEYHPEDAEKTGFSGYSYWRSTLRVFTRNKMAMFLLGVIIVLLLFTFIQPYLPGQRDPIVINNDENGIQIINMKPNSEFWFGTNSIGQDLWSRVWSGTRTSLFIGFSVAMWEVAFGILIGFICYCVFIVTTYCIFIYFFGFFVALSRSNFIIRYFCGNITDFRLCL